MPRDLPLGNGSLLVNFDRAYTLRDIYYPYVGSENQTNGHPCRVGVWADGRFAWLHDDGWQRELKYKQDTLVTDVVLAHQGLGLLIYCEDAVDFHEDVLVRHLRVKDMAGRDRQVRLFFHHDFHLYGNDIGDTVYFDPYTQALIHYKGRRYMLMLGGVVADGAVDVGLHGYACGVKEAGGREGTWRDAEDGILGGNPIAQGSVDSVAQLNVNIPAGGEGEAYFWVGAAQNHSDVADLNQRIMDKTPAQLIRRTADYWRLWANKEEFDYGHLPQEMVSAFKRSLLVIRTQIDERGAILAANDADIVQFARDTYSYMWPRDASLVCYALSLAGYDQVPQRFFNFCREVISRHGYFLHKYNPDGSLASSWHPWVNQTDGKEEQLPVQEDETALVLWAIWEFFLHKRTVEVMKPLFRPLIVAAADFLASFRDPNTGLPLPSYDLWEERHGVHAFTVGTVYGGLMSACNLTAAFGEVEKARYYADAAQGIKRAVEKYMYDHELGRFVRMVRVHSDGTIERDRTVDASMYALWYCGMFAVDDPRITRTMQAIHDVLWCDTPVGGLARYENDYYQRVPTPAGARPVPGNPWFVCTMWYAQYLIASATNHQELEKAFQILQWAVDSCLPSGVMAEQVHPYTGEPLSVSPLTWSHAAFVTTLLEYLDRHSELGLCEGCGLPMYFRERNSIRRSHRHDHWYHSKDASLQPGNPGVAPESVETG
jgi:GH15 family glucan-1,4-alpha-glucosidase